MYITKALLIGIPYTNTPYYLPGCSHDITIARLWLTTHQGLDSSVITELPATMNGLVTKQDILTTISRLNDDMNNNDVLFVLFAGHSRVHIGRQCIVTYEKKGTLFVSGFLESIVSMKGDLICIYDTCKPVTSCIFNTIYSGTKTVYTMTSPDNVTMECPFGGVLTSSLLASFIGNPDYSAIDHVAAINRKYNYIYRSSVFIGSSTVI